VKPWHRQPFVLSAHGQPGDVEANLVPMSSAQMARSSAWSAVRLSATLSALLLSGSSASAAAPAPASVSAAVLKSDEIEVLIESEPLGLGLVEVQYKGSARTVIKSIKDYAAEATRAAVRPGLVVVSVNGQSVEGLSLDEVYRSLKGADKPLRLVLRDPDLFFKQLSAPLQGKAERFRYTTTLLPTLLAPGGLEQVIAVERIPAPSASALRSLAVGDTVEILYQARAGPPVDMPNTPLASYKVIDGVSDQVFKSDEYKDVYASSVFFVLGSPKENSKYTFFGTGGESQSKTTTQSDSPFPARPGELLPAQNVGTVPTMAEGARGSGGVLQLIPTEWDCLLVGMGIGERRIVSLPTAFLSKPAQRELTKLKWGGGSLIVEVKVLSINGVAN